MMLENNLILFRSKVVLTFTVINTVSYLVLVTTFGIFWKQIMCKNLLIRNFENLLIVQNKNLVFISGILTLAYTSVFLQRYYIKVRGLGFSIKYLLKPMHFLLLRIGFSKALYLKVPCNIFIIKKPRKKKFILTLISANSVLLQSFVNLLKELKIPDPYKLKGIRMVTEYFSTKQGKKKK